MAAKSLTVALKEMREVSHTGDPVPFSIKYVRADRRRNSAGSFAYLANCIIKGAHKQSTRQKHNDRLNEIKNTKDPDHRANGTINIYHVPTDQFKKVHIRLITHFNEERVVYQ